MISAVESVAIGSEGQVELESTSKDAYAKVLILAVGSFLGDAAFKLKKKQLLNWRQKENRHSNPNLPTSTIDCGKNSKTKPSSTYKDRIGSRNSRKLT